MKISKKFLKAIQEAVKPKTTAYDTEAKVTRIEGSTAWVHIPGGVDETPVKLTIDAKTGDTVQVRVGGGKAFLVGNSTAPPTDDTTANKAVSQIKTVNKIVNTVKAVADKAARIAANTNQYFWFVENGTDTGAHITEIPQEDFLTDPTNGGGNLLARSNGIAVRDGMTELATFSSTEAVIGQTTARNISIGTSDIEITDGSNDADYVKLGLPSVGSIVASYVEGVDGDENPLYFFSDHKRAGFSATYQDPNNSIIQSVSLDAETGLKVSNPYGTGNSVISSTNADFVVPVTAPNQQAGTIGQCSVSASSYSDFSITFGETFSSAPVVVACFQGSSTAAAFGSMSLAVRDITTTGCKVRIFNNTSATREPYVSWIAVGW